MILIDFIDMKKREHTAQVAEALRACLREDPVKADFVDFTKLGLAELTRKRKRHGHWWSNSGKRMHDNL